MKTCSVCGASLPDQATFCVSCGSTEFINENESGQFSQYNQQYQQDYNNGQYGEQYQEDYDNGQYGEQYQGDYNNGQYGEQYQEDYNNEYGEQYQEDYNNGQYGEQYQEDYNNGQYGEQYQEDYNNGQYGEQYQQDYNNGQYGEQYQEDYNNGQYGEQYQEDYNNGQYGEQYQEDYDNGQYQNAYEQQQQYTASSDNNTEQPEQEKKEDYDPIAKIKEKEAKNPYESSKDFKFEKREETDEEQDEQKPAPKNIKEFIAMLRDTKDHTFEYDVNDIQQNKTLSIISCIGITFWVPMAFKGGSRVGRFYANQGILIFITSIISSILYAIFSGIVGVACTTYTNYDFTHTIPTLSFGGVILDIIFFAICFAVPIFMFVCAFLDIRAGKVKDIPLIGKLRLLRI